MIPGEYGQGRTGVFMEKLKILTSGEYRSILDHDFEANILGYFSIKKNKPIGTGEQKDCL